MKKILFVANLDSFFTKFLIPQLKYFKDLGYIIHVVSKNENIDLPYCDKKINIPFARSFNIKENISSYFQTKKLINKKNYDIVYCHTPFGGAIGRLASRKARKKGTKVIYMVHGFHFYKGAPIIKWLLYYYAEKYLARFTDLIITINKEDYEIAKKKFNTKVEYINGVGLDTEKFNFDISLEEKNKLLKSLGLKEDNFIITYPAEINKNKNQLWLIKTLSKIIKENNNIHLLLPGNDKLKGKCQKLAVKLRVNNNIHFLGFRKDIPKLLNISSLAVSSSKREGLPVNIMEAIYVGLPVVATECRGNRDLIINGKNGYIVKLNDYESFNLKVMSYYNGYDKIKILETNKNIINKFVLDGVMKKFDSIMEPYISKKGNKIKVLHILMSNKFSGAEKVAYKIILNCSDEIDMAYCSPKGPVTSVLKEGKIKYIRLYGKNIFSIRRAIKKYNPDIIHAHDYRASALVAFSGYRGKIISHLHNNNPFIRTWNINSIIYNLAIPKFDKIIGVANIILKEAIFKKRMQHKFVTIYNYVDKKQIIIKSKKYNVKEKYDIFFLGRFSEPKNPEGFIDIINEYRKQSPNVKSIMIGDGELFDYCKNKIISLGLEKNIILHGFASNPFPIIRNSSLGIMPSKWEGFGFVALESMCLKKPVLNSGVGGFSEMLCEHSEFICNNMDEYLSKINKYLNSKDKINFSFINKYTNKKSWKNQFMEVYFDKDN
ncbi:MAG TPA: glycosyltransferase [Bacilli bacterium]|nr:glycosyltransferase [Bacilli bacterium]